MEPLPVIHLLDEPTDRRLGFFKGLVLLQIHLLFFQRAEQPLRLRVLQRRALRRHADARPGGLQPLDIGRTRILHPPVRVVDPTRRRLPLGQCPLQGGQGQFGLQRARQAPAHHPPRVGIHHRRQIDELPTQADIGQVGHPRLIQAGQPSPPAIRQPVGIDPPTVRAVGRLRPPPLQLTQQALLAHDPQHPLAVDVPALALQMLGYPPITIAGKLQHYPLHRCAQRERTFFWSVARCALGIACIGTPIMAPPVEAQQRARPLDRHLGKALAAAFHQRPLLVRAKPPFWTVSRAWRRKWFSRVARPKAASSAAMRAWGSSPTWRVGSGSRQAFSPWAWYWSRQRRSSVWQSPCSRQSWAKRFSPLTSWRTTCSLNSRLNDRFMRDRLLVGDRLSSRLPLLLDMVTLHYSSCVSQLRGSPQEVTASVAPLGRPDVCTASNLDFEEGHAREPALRPSTAAGRLVYPGRLKVNPAGACSKCAARRSARLGKDDAGEADLHHPPPVSFEEALECTMIHSISGLLPANAALVTTRPFRLPHHSVSDAGLIGGGSIPKPGEVTLAHHGVLFLDELPEFKREVLEVLRQPLEDGKLTISRAAASLTYPARCTLVAAMNPCPCGYATDNTHSCSCPPHQIQRYLQRISGPLLDRIDIHIEVPRLQHEELLGRPQGEPSTVIRARVMQAQIRKYCGVNGEVKELLRSAIQQLALSARAYDRILKLSRTIADLAGAADIGVPHVAEAIQYRTLDRRLWG